MAERGIYPLKFERAGAGTKEITTSGLLHSIINSQGSGISSILLRAIASTKLDEWKKAQRGTLLINETFISDVQTAIKKGDYATPMNKLADYLDSQGKYLVDWWKAGIGLDMGSAFASLIESYTGYPVLLSLATRTKLDYAVRPHIERWFSSYYTPNIPNSRMAFEMHMEGKLSRAEFNKYCLLDGWASEWPDKLYEVWNTDPRSYQAFLMYKRGLMSKARMYECFKIEGYDPSWHTALEQSFYRIPNLGELIRTSDFVELSDMYVRECLRKNGYDESSILFMAPAIQRRPLREEIRSLTTTNIYNYQNGYINLDLLKANFNALKLLPLEKALDLQYAELRYTQNLITLSLDVITQLTSKRILFTEEMIKTEIMAVGVVEEVANLLAEKLFLQYIQEINTFTITIAVNDPAMGTTNPVPGYWNRYAGQTYWIYATPTGGHEVEKWTEDNVLKQTGGNYYTTLVDMDKTVKCWFKVI